MEPERQERAREGRFIFNREKNSLVLMAMWNWEGLRDEWTLPRPCADSLEKCGYTVTGKVENHMVILSR